MTPATRLYLMGFDTAFILAKYMPEDPDAFIAEVEEEARRASPQVTEVVPISVYRDRFEHHPEEARKIIEDNTHG